MSKANDTIGHDLRGEGNYTAARRFRQSEEKFVARNRRKIPGMGKDAEEALDGPEGDELRAAEDRARSHSRGKASDG
ncbi:MAG: hypothetical protein ABSD74_15535 [Rhizomicrobium sp.]|jgi:hypothetical protein